MNQPFVPVLRPSTILGHLISCSPNQMPAAYEHFDGGLLGYLSRVTVVDAAANGVMSINTNISRSSSLPGSECMSGSVSGKKELDSVSLSYPQKGDNIRRQWGLSSGETGAWQGIQGSIDVLVQRTAVMSDESGSSASGSSQRAALLEWADALMEVGQQTMR